MPLFTHLDETFSFANALTLLDKLNGLLDPELLKQAFEHAGVAIVRKRGLPIDAVLWSVVGISLFR